LWGAAGLTASAGLAGWVEMLMLRRTLNVRIGRTGLSVGYVLMLWGAATASAGVGFAIKSVVPPLHPVLTAGVVLGPYGVVYLGSMLAFRVPEASVALRLGRRR
jgi:putative peptidoglycan lipid II flippase